MSQLTIPDFEIDVAHVDQIEDLSNLERKIMMMLMFLPLLVTLLWIFILFNTHDGL